MFDVQRHSCEQAQLQNGLQNHSERNEIDENDFEGMENAYKL
jgi:hypothetical protein